ncbi:hypothetical protein FGB62_17g461 [Gracilaria domingensis]|nr:hypothetical protein FGB62_17g461 [Gracilaria domingensis]
MPSRLSSTNSLSDGGLPKGHRVLSADGRRWRNARNRQRQKRKRKGLKGKDSSSSEPRTPSTISLSIAPSEIIQAKQLNPAVEEEQQNVSGDIMDAIENILEVLDNDKRINSSPTAVVKTVLEDSDNVQTTKQKSNCDVSQRAPVEQQSVPEFQTTVHLRLKPSDTAESPRSSRMQTSRKGSDILQSTEDRVEGKLCDGQNVPRRAANCPLKIIDPGKAPRTLCAEEPSSSKADTALGHSLLPLSGNSKLSTTTSKRRRLDFDYTFAESQTAPVPNVSILQDCQPSIQRSREVLSEGKKSMDADADNQIGNVVKSKFLDDILDLEKGVEFRLPDMGKSNIIGVGEEKGPMVVYPMQIDGENEEKSISGHEAEQRTAKNIVNEAAVNERGANQVCYPQEDENLIRIKNSAVNDVSKMVVQSTTHGEEEMEKELRITSNVLEKSRNPLATNERGKEHSTGKRMRSASSVSAALRFARKQKMLQEGGEVKPNASEKDVPTQELLCLNPKPRKRKKKKRKTGQPLDAKQMMNEEQYNESFFVGFRNEAGDSGIRTEDAFNDDFMLPPPSLLEDTVEMRDPCLATCTTKENRAQNVIHGVSHIRQDEAGNLLNEDHGSHGKDVQRVIDGSLSKGGEEVDLERSAVIEISPPVIEVDEEVPAQYEEEVDSGLEVPKEIQPRDKAEEKGGEPERLFVKEARTALLNNNSGNDQCPDDIEPAVPAAQNERIEISGREPPQYSNDRNQLSLGSRSEDSRAELDFEDKRKFFDDMVTLMIDTTVELEFFCKDLFRVKSKVRDESPP